jgi:hypothetical protein
MLHAKETGAQMIVVDPRHAPLPRRTSTCGSARHRHRVPVRHVPHLKNGWEAPYIHDRVYGMDKVRGGDD